MSSGISGRRSHSNYSPTYHTDLFYLWYNNQKPNAKLLHQMIPEEWGEKKPTQGTLVEWINKEFVPKSRKMDAEFKAQMEGEIVRRKVEMLHRHSEVGRKMQNKAMAFIDSIDPEDLGEHAAVRMLVEGIRIERDSVGLPEALEKLISQSDEELLDRVMKITGESEVELLED